VLLDQPLIKRRDQPLTDSIDLDGPKAPLTVGHRPVLFVATGKASVHGKAINFSIGSG
jgi:hypothetical protein